MTLLLSWHRASNTISSFADLVASDAEPGAPNRWRNRLTPSSELVTAIRRFRETVDLLAAGTGDWKLELVRLDNRYWLRLCDTTPPVRYRLVPATDTLRLFRRRNRGLRSRRPEPLPLPSDTWHLVTGPHAEKLLHEWLSHPAENGCPLPDGVTLDNVLPGPHATKDPRLVRGRIRPGPIVPLPTRFLFIRTVSDGRYDPVHRRIHLTVRESFARTADLLQSIRTFRCELSLADLNQGFAGAVSRQCWPAIGFFCSKFGQPVFGHIESPPLLFRNIQLLVEE